MKYEKAILQRNYIGRDDHGTVIVYMNDKNKLIINLIQDAYIVNEDLYKSSGKDEEGNLYDIFWEITNRECENEEDACDWKKIYDIKEI